jgi:hypothetical protein
LQTTGSAISARACNLDGGKSGGPRGERNGAHPTGRYTAEAKAENRQVRMLIRELSHLVDSSEWARQVPHFAAKAVFRLVQAKAPRRVREVPDFRFLGHRASPGAIATVRLGVTCPW